MAKKIAKTISLTVVGMQYRITPSTRQMMKARIEEVGPIECKLKRDPENEHDPNAIKVVVVAGPYKNLHVGYLRRQVAEILAPAFDKGEAVPGICLLTAIEPRDGEGEIRIKLKVTVKFGLAKLISEG